MEDFQIDIVDGSRRLREDVQAAARAVHADRRDDAGRHAVGAAARALRHRPSSGLLRRRRAGTHRLRAAPACSTCRSTPRAPRRSPPQPRHAAHRQPPAAARARLRRGARRRRASPREVADGGAAPRRRRRARPRPARPRVPRTIVEQYGGGPVGIAAIAATLTEDAETLEDVVEPYLLKRNLVVRTASGRKVTAAAYDHLAIARAADAEQPRLL